MGLNIFGTITDAVGDILGLGQTSQPAANTNDWLSDWLGPKPDKQPSNTGILANNKLYENRDQATADLDASDTGRGIFGDLGQKCIYCGHYCGSKSAYVAHLETSHQDKIQKY